LCELLHHEAKQLAEYKTVVSKLRSAQSKRNLYAHNGMVYNEETGKTEMPLGSARGKLKVDLKTIEIDVATNALYKLVLD